MSKKNGGPVTLFGLVFFVGLLVWINADKTPATATEPKLTLEQQAGTYMSQIAQVVGVAPVGGNDGDSSSNLLEKLSGTDPLLPASYPANAALPDEKHYITLLPDGAFMRDADTLRCVDFMSARPGWWDTTYPATQQLIIDHCAKVGQ